MNFQEPWQYTCEEDYAPLDIQLDDDLTELRRVLKQIQVRQLEDKGYERLISYRYFTLNTAAGLLLGIANRARDYRRGT